MNIGDYDDVQALVHLYAGDMPVARKRRRRRPPEGLIENVGRAVHDLGHELRGMLAFVGDVVLSITGLLKEPSTGNWRDVSPTVADRRLCSRVLVPKLLFCEAPSRA